MPISLLELGKKLILVALNQLKRQKAEGRRQKAEGRRENCLLLVNEDLLRVKQHLKSNNLSVFYCVQSLLRVG
ncbi:MAG: hypothetical protein F6K54_39820 [Okeania sp. SIO3B5]|uniref:hypothetical protein n=1 Tax=Okeania sp. SIO3B5 TaxID=2607811 RepID=UPI001400F15A|nr:hypothetical protein [Okeania sp. SIO3B5]NEO58657.1 hypothetical protein [Okeania sp. SIO3B5]